MTMELADDAFFRSYLTCLNNNQLSRLIEWQGERISADPSKDIVLDATSKKRLIYLEIKRRRDNV